MEQPQFKPLTLGEIVRRSLRLYGDTLATVVILALIAHAPLLLLGSIMTEETPPDPLPALGLLVVILVVTGVVVNAIYLAALSSLVGRPAGIGPLLRWSLRRSSAAVMLAYIISNFLSHIGLLLFVVPGVLMGGLLAVAVPVVIVERKGAFAAIARSFALLRQDWIKGIGVFVFATVVSELLPLQVLLGMQFFVERSPYFPLLAAVLAASTMPLALLANLHLYLSLRAAELEGSRADTLRMELLRLFPDPP